jgi:hypothetical protein
VHSLARPFTGTKLSKQLDHERFSKYKTLDLAKMTFRLARETIRSFKRRHRLASRLISVLFVLILLFSIVYPVIEARMRVVEYSLAPFTNLIGSPTTAYAEKLVYDEQGGLTFNRDYSPGGDRGGDSGQAKITARFGDKTEKYTVTVTDPASNVNIAIQPNFSVGSPKKEDNRVVYPIRGKDAMKVFTVKGSGIKEDIIFTEKPSQDMVKFEYTVSLSEGVELRMNDDGSLGAYGVQNVLLGNVSTGSEEDAKLLESARQNGEKTNLLFTLPAPFVVGADGKKDEEVASWFSLEGNQLTLWASGLGSASYPLSIDPTIYVETARKLMRGNNETNADFDTTNELIQKSRTTGARIDGWVDTTEMDSGLWDHSVATAGGFIYRAGGRVDPTMPYIVGQQATKLNTASTSFVMNMPAVRPAGDLYVALIAHDGTGVITPPAGWTEYADNDAGGGNTREHAAYYKEGTDQGGGNESATYTFTGGSEQWVGVIVRIRGFNVGSPISGSAGRTFSASDAIPQFPAVTPSHDASLIIRAVAVDEDQPSDYTWLPSGHTRIYSGTSNYFDSPSTDTPAESVGIVVATVDQPPLATNAQAAVNLVDDGILVDSYGASSIAIRPATVTAGYQSDVEWAEFDSDDLSIASPNAGAGLCTGWCSSSVYDLPANRVGMSMVAYNGYLYAMGGTTDGTAANGRNTLWIAKLGANGEPQLWHPTDTNQNNWTYWYSSAYTLPSARSYASVAAYKNRLYLVGGRDTAGSSINSVHVTDFAPNGDVTGWVTTNMQDLTTPTARYGHSVHIYNDTMYIIGGNNNGTLRNTVYYSKLTSAGNMNSWVQTSTFTTGRMSYGGQMTGVWGAYIYLAGGCSALTSGYCSTIQSDVQLASINADGSLAPWNSISTLSNQRIGYSFVAWQGGLYRLGGCNRQNTSTGVCYATHRDVEYGPVNPEGDASTVSNSEPANTSPCSGATPTNCDLPGAGDGTEQGGQMSSALAINNGYIYVIGGCTFVDAAGNEVCHDGGVDRSSGNVMYAELNADGEMTKPATCSGTFVTNSLWCVDSQNTIYEPTALYSTGTLSQTGTTVTGAGTTWVAAHVGRTLRYADGTTALITARASNTSITVNVSKTVAGGTTYGFHANGIATASATVFNNVLYVAGGTNGADWKDEIFRAGLNSDGSLAGAWESQTFAGVGMTGTADDQRGYMYTFARANPSSSGTNPGNYYLMGGCRGGGGATDNGVGCGAYYTDVVKCNIATDTSINGCTTTGQMQIDADNINAGSQGIGLMAGTVYANRVYLVGGACTQVGTPVNATDPCAPTYSGNRKDTIYARIDASNNIVDNTTGLSTGAWAFTTGQMSPVRRRAVAFGYNGHIYSLAGYSGTASLQDLLFAKIDVSTGDMGSFNSSGVVVTPRWDLKAIVNNGYVYAIGGCGDGAAPQDCVSMQPEIQTFQLYNNDSGSPVDYTVGANLFTGDRTGAGSTILNGYLYVAGGCASTSTIDCDTAVSTVQYSPIDANGNLGTWLAGGALPDVRAWGQLEAVGGTLYFIGGQNSGGTAQTSVFWTTGITSGNPTWNGTAATQSLPSARSQHGATVWNNRLYVTGGFGSGGTCASSGVCDTVYVSPALPSGGNITGTWQTSTTFNIDRSGHTTVAYANNLYVIGGYDGAEYLNDVQYASIGYKTGTIAQSGTTVTGTGTNWTSAQHLNQIIQYPDGSTATITAVNSTTSLTVDENKTVPSSTIYTIFDGSVGTWGYTTSLPKAVRNADGFAANGYMYLMGGRDSSGECAPSTLVGPISANTTIATGNNPTGIGEWYETNESYSGDRYGSSVAYAGGKAYMTGGACGFPSVSKINTQTFTTNTTAHLVNMPSTVNVGDLLVVLFTNDGNATVTTPAGWTQVRTQVSGTAVRGSIYAKDAAGTEDSTRVDFVTSATEQAAAQVFRIPASKWNGNIADIEADTGTAATTQNPNPASFNPTGWATENTLWIAYAAGGSYASSSVSPTNFGDRYHTTSASGAAGASVTSARYESAVGSMDPSAFTMDASQASIAFTIAIRPAAFAYTGANRVVQTPIYSQPQVALYSRLIDTDTNVFPTSWLMNGIDNSIGARWQAQYRSAIDASNVIHHQSFDDGINGNSVTPGNSSYNSCYSNGTATNQYSNAQFVTSGLSMRINVAAGSGNGGCRDDTTDTTVRYDRFYVYFSAAPSATTMIYQISNTADTGFASPVAQLRLTTARQIQLRDEFTQDAITTTALDANRWHRIEVATTGGVMTVRVFNGNGSNNPHIATPTETISDTLTRSSYSTFGVQQVGLLELLAAPMTLYVDEHKSSASNWVGTAFPGWGQNTIHGDVIMGDVSTYTPLDASGVDTDFSRWHYFYVSIDASQTFGYPEDVQRGPTISDLSLFFTADPNKRLRHGKTFTGGEQQPLDTPCRQTVDAQCPLP